MYLVKNKDKIHFSRRSNVGLKLQEKGYCRLGWDCALNNFKEMMVT